MEFESLIDKQVNFYGVDYNTFKLGDTVYEALEDEADGWRSYLGSIETVGNNGIFFSSPLAEVIVERCTERGTDGFQLRDVEDGHIWLTVGTGNCDDWYPYFEFYYNAKTK